MKPQHSIAVRPKLIKQLQFTAMEILKCLEGEESAWCLCMFRTPRKEGDVSEEMCDYLTARWGNVYLNTNTHTVWGVYLTFLCPYLFIACHSGRR